MATKRLRILSYMCKDLPTDVFYLMRDVIEEATGLETDLVCENRFSGPTEGRADPFEENLADIGLFFFPSVSCPVIVHSTDYLRLKAANHPGVELCQAAPVHAHSEADGRPVYFSEIVVRSANKDKYKSMKDLKGCRWAYSEDTSISGNTAVLSHLRHAMGTNASYFGSIVQSGSHLTSLRMVLDYRVDAAAVDSTVLSSFIRQHPDQSDAFTTLVSLGPLPIYPLLFNQRLSDELKAKVTECLLSLDRSDKWTDRMTRVKLVKFAPVKPDFYQLEEQVTQRSKGMEINMAYY